jgi:Flp pilus assembly protein TadB
MAEKRAVREQLPDVIDRLVAHIESGVGFDHAAWEVTKEMDNELSRAFGLYLEEVKSALDAGRREGVLETLKGLSAQFHAE